MDLLAGLCVDGNDGLRESAISPCRQMTKEATMKLGLGALAIAAGLFVAGSAQAQYYEQDPYRRPPPPYGYDRRPPPPDGYYRRERRYGSACVTSRGTCATEPGPIGISCRCMIPGFGKKRGSIE